MTDDERDHSIAVLAKVTFEVQIWAAALKEILISKGITTDEEFARYVAAAQRSQDMGELDSNGNDGLSGADNPNG
jgi:ribosomal protein L12E/L44/L45/RPP1/RPP2